jgi:uncharacterized repeat protein (TIGR01451 family)
VIVSGPLTAAVGDNVQFQIQVTNRGMAPATKLLVTDRFDVGLEQAAATSPIEHDLADLAPGATTRLTVNFRIARAGELCQDIQVTGEGGVRGTARHCLNAAAPAAEPRSPGDQRWEPESPAVPAAPGQSAPSQPSTAQPPAGAAPPVALSLRKSGGDRRRVGETVLFTIEVFNRGQQALEDVVIADNFETSLEPSQATKGNEWLEGGALGWKVGTLAPGASEQRDIELKCLRETPRACNRVTVTAKDMQPLAEEACLEIVAAADGAAPAPAPRRPLSVSVAETTDPVRVGGTTTYQVVLENKDSQSYFDVVVSASLGDQLSLVSIGGPVEKEGPIMQNSVRFRAIRELRAGEAPLSFELRTSAIRAGSARVRVEVTSRGQQRPIVAEQSTQVIP